MKSRDYYSTRTGKLPESPELTLKLLKKFFLITFEQLEERGFFQKYFGYYCVDQGDVSGELGSNVTAMVFLALKKENLWPLKDRLDQYSEDDLFDMIEYMHDHCSEPLVGDYHGFNNCGYHYNTFDDASGQSVYREKLNRILKDYKSGFELSPNGELLELPDKNLVPLLEAEIPTTDTENVTKKIELAILKFRRHRSTWEDRRDALRELADVLEYLRPKVKDALISQDESDIYNIANNFGIRHHNLNQKYEYDKAIWYSWIFHYYLATIHAVLRMIRRKELVAKA